MDYGDFNYCDLTMVKYSFCYRTSMAHGLRYYPARLVALQCKVPEIQSNLPNTSTESALKNKQHKKGVSTVVCDATKMNLLVEGKSTLFSDWTEYLTVFYSLWIRYSNILKSNPNKCKTLLHLLLALSMRRGIWYYCEYRYLHLSLSANKMVCTMDYLVYHLVSVFVRSSMVKPFLALFL